ncbi:MAG: tRNA pseudouridine(55) synthase TruB [Micrococcales bacterium]|nr:tRNA pseudouridine(55) synthase TruB [Micrococcales bacterium]
MTDSSPNGLLVVDKPAGWTSHDVVGWLRKLLGTKKIGHAGTLDPMATGVLVVGVGKGTRLLTYLVGLDKTYTATIRLGQATNTDDSTGQITFLAEPGVVTGLSAELIGQAVAQLTGPIMQVPSAVSAIKVDGQRAYARVRAGEKIELEPRSVTVHRFDVLQHNRPPSCHPAHREAVSQDPDTASASHATPTGESQRMPALMPLADAALMLFQPRHLASTQVNALTHGRFIEATPDLVGSKDCPVAGISPDGQLVALLADKDGQTRPLVVFA